MEGIQAAEVEDKSSNTIHRHIFRHVYIVYPVRINNDNNN